MINKKFQNFFNDVGSPRRASQKLKFDIFSKFLKHPVAYDQHNFQNFFSDVGST